MSLPEVMMSVIVQIGAGVLPRHHDVVVADDAVFEERLASAHMPTVPV